MADLHQNHKIAVEMQICNRLIAKLHDKSFTVSGVCIDSIATYNFEMIRNVVLQQVKDVADVAISCNNRATLWNKL